MPDQRKLRIPALIAAAVATLGVWGFFHAAVNQKYPNPTEQVFYLGEPFVYRGLQFEFSDFYAMPRSEFIAEFQLDENRLDLPMGEEKDVAFRVRVSNVSDHLIEINLAEWMLLETEGYSTYTDLLSLYTAMNTDYSLCSLQPGQSRTMWFPYTLFDFQFAPKDFDRLEELPFQVVFSLYPVKTVVRLNRPAAEPE